MPKMLVTGAIVEETQVVFNGDRDYKILYKGKEMPGWHVTRVGREIKIMYFHNTFKAIIHFKDKATTTLEVAMITNKFNKTLKI